MSRADSREGGRVLAQSALADDWTRVTTVFWLMQTIADVPMDDDWLAAAERGRLAALRIPKRRRDWRLGRWTAKQALARLTLDGAGAAALGPADVVIQTHANGAPYASVDGAAVPCGISISHSHGRAICAVGPAGTAVGCDLERVEPRVEGFTADWFTRAEQDAIARAGTGDRDRLVTLLWSAKESVLKTIGTGLTISTHDVEVSVDTPQDGDWSPLHASRRGEPERMHGWWRTDGDDLITLVTVPAMGRPVGLGSVPRVD